MALLQLATEETHFCLMVGRIFSRHTLACAEFVGNEAWLHQNDIDLIESKAKEFSVTEGMTRLIRLFRQHQVRTFYELYELMFDIQISTEEGWQRLKIIGSILCWKKLTVMILVCMDLNLTSILLLI